MVSFGLQTINLFLKQKRNNTKSGEDFNFSTKLKKNRNNETVQLFKTVQNAGQEL